MLSIIIPTHNEENYLPKLLKCIKKQDYKNYEIIVADADSKDNTRKIAKKYGCRIVKGGMPAVGRNNGAKAAKGGVLLFMDADMQIYPNFLEKSLDEIEKRGIGAASCHIMPLGKNVIDRIFFMIFNIWASATQLFYHHASGGVIFCKTAIHKKIRGFDKTIKLGEDMDYAKRCGKVGKFRMLRGVSANVSMRRFEKEGRFKVGLKILLGAFYRIFIGEIRTDIFRYGLKYKK